MADAGHEAAELRIGAGLLLQTLIEVLHGEGGVGGIDRDQGDEGLALELDRLQGANQDRDAPHGGDLADPTLPQVVSQAQAASAAVDAMTRCVEAYLSNAYNPPADGIALDGLRRALACLERIEACDTPDVRREIMASEINAALASQKGVGMVQSLGNALAGAAKRHLDQGKIARILLPEILRYYATAAAEKYDTLRRIFSIGETQSLSDGVGRLLDRLPLPKSLSELGVSESEIDRAARATAPHLSVTVSPRYAESTDLLGVMRAVL